MNKTPFTLYELPAWPGADDEMLLDYLTALDEFINDQQAHNLPCEVAQRESKVLWRYFERLGDEEEDYDPMIYEERCACCDLLIGERDDFDMDLCANCGVYLREQTQAKDAEIARLREALNQPSETPANRLFTIIIEHADEPTTDTEAWVMGSLPTGFEYLSPILTAPEFRKLSFVVDLTRVTITAEDYPELSHNQ